jgi:anthranilate phosphoribosyltransferase
MTADPPFTHWLGEIASGRPLSEAEAEAAFRAVMAGQATPAQIGGFLMGLRVRGETVAEITGAARVMRANALKIEAPGDALDTCGTGGDASGSFNISTAAAFVAAACGIPVAKHGNRRLSSRAGSADVLSALGVNIDAPMENVVRSIREVGIGFMMAPRHHAATRHVAAVRVELVTRTIFNLLGPLSNPANVKRQLMGVYAPQWVRPLAEVLQRLGAVSAWVVHGDGMDELTTTGTNEVATLADGRLGAFALDARDLGLARVRQADIAGGDAQDNARIMRDLFAGTAGPIRDIVLLNAAAALTIAGRSRTLADGLTLAGEAIDHGRATTILDRLIVITNEAA